MRTRSRAGRLVCFFTLLSVAAFGAERVIPYSDLHSMFARVASLQGGKYVKAEARLNSTDPAVPTAEILLVIRSRTGEIRVPVAADGATDFPIRADLLAENPPVLTNTAEGKLQLGIGLRVEAPPEQRFRYGLMVDMQDEVKATIAKQGMMARLFAPDFGGLVISFPDGTTGSATVEAAAGPVHFAADAENRVRIPDRRDWRRENPYVQLSATPAQIALDVD